MLQISSPEYRYNEKIGDICCVLAAKDCEVIRENDLRRYFSEEDIHELVGYYIAKHNNRDRLDYIIEAHDSDLQKMVSLFISYMKNINKSQREDIGRALLERLCSNATEIAIGTIIDDINLRLPDEVGHMEFYALERESDYSNLRA